jgi:hypothetical protein
VTEDRASGETSEMFAERLLLVIDEGRRTATYKLALLLALIDACAANADDRGRAPAVLHTRTIAHHVVALYLPQARTYLSGGEPRHLDQITSRRSAVFRAILALHVRADAARCRSLTEIARRLPDDYEQCLDVVEETFARYPLRLLQVVGREHRPFLYDIDWTDSVRLSALHADGGGQVRFRPAPATSSSGSLPCSARSSSCTGPAWWRASTASTSRKNASEPTSSAPSARPSLLRCAAGSPSCRRGAASTATTRSSASTAVDHVIPWARQPNDAIENLVLADRCNGAKRDYLPALAHVDRWARRLTTRHDELGPSPRPPVGRPTPSDRWRSCARPTPTSPPALADPLWRESRSTSRRRFMRPPSPTTTSRATACSIGDITALRGEDRKSLADRAW